MELRDRRFAEVTTITFAATSSFWRNAGRLDGLGHDGAARDDLDDRRIRRQRGRRLGCLDQPVAAGRTWRRHSSSPSRLRTGSASDWSMGRVVSRR